MGVERMSEQLPSDALSTPMPSKELVQRIDACLHCFWIDRAGEERARGLLREAMEALRATGEPPAVRMCEVCDGMLQRCECGCPKCGCSKCRPSQPPGPVPA